MSSPAPRAATPSDAETVARLLDAFNREYHAPTPGPEVLATRMQSLLAGSDVIALLAGDPAVAVALLTLRPNVWYDGPIVLVDYDPQWPRLFEREEARIRSALGGRALQVEHTGSTSVPGLAAKPIVDIVLVVADSTDTTLSGFRERRSFHAEDGRAGGGGKRSGHHGSDLTLHVPVGTIVREGDVVLADLDRPGAVALAARGGRGGRHPRLHARGALHCRSLFVPSVK